MKSLLFLFLFTFSTFIYAQGNSLINGNRPLLKVENDNLFFQTEKGEGVYKLSNVELNFINATVNFINSNAPDLSDLKPGNNKVNLTVNGKRYGINRFTNGVPFRNIKTLLESLELEVE